MSYAQALFELSKEQKREKDVYHAALILKECLLAQPRYLAVLTSPVIANQERLSLVRELLQNAPAPLRNTILLLCEKNHAFRLTQILEQYITRYRKKNGILEVTAWSAAPLSAQTIKRLESALQGRFDREILLEAKVDETCIGGLKLQMNGRQYDGSLARQFDEISHMLLDNARLMQEINLAEEGGRQNA